MYYKQKTLKTTELLTAKVQRCLWNLRFNLWVYCHARNCCVCLLKRDLLHPKWEDLEGQQISNHSNRDLSWTMHKQKQLIQHWHTFRKISSVIHRWIMTQPPLLCSQFITTVSGTLHEKKVLYLVPLLFFWFTMVYNGCLGTAWGSKNRLLQMMLYHRLSRIYKNFVLFIWRNQLE